MSVMRPVTLITGASAGIGWALAEIFAQHGHELVLAARRMSELDRLADKIAASGAPRPAVIGLDLGHPGVGDRLAAELAARGLAPRHVVNNAGFGLIGAADGLDRTEQLAMIDLNVRTVTDLSLAFIRAFGQPPQALRRAANAA